MRTVLLLALFLHAAIVADIATAASDVAMTIDRHAGGVTISGTTSSSAHEAILRQTAERSFPGQVLEFEFSGPATAPPGWALVTDMALRAAAATRRARIEISRWSVSTSGVTTDRKAWSGAIARVGHALPDGMVLRDEVVAIRPDRSHADRCLSRFRRLAVDQSIEFLRSGAELSAGSYAGLDGLLELAVDCPDLHLGITGHTDDSGDEHANQRLSLARADAVAAYLIERGLPATRIVTRGAGSTEPLVENVDAEARQRNRRVQISALAP